MEHTTTASPALGMQSPDPAHRAISAEGGAIRRNADPVSAFSDADREQAIERAARLSEFFMAERALYEALWERHGDFGHKGSADAARANAAKANDLMVSLVRGRSAAQMARMERALGLDLPVCANEGRRG